jgi:hypothetical protein
MLLTDRVGLARPVGGEKSGNATYTNPGHYRPQRFRDEPMAASRGL